jgi:CSLREA domain-containing protein
MVLLGIFLSALADAAVFTVNSNSDLSDSKPGDGVCHTGAAVPTCTLRAAIQEANALAGAVAVASSTSAH